METDTWNAQELIKQCVHAEKTMNPDKTQQVQTRALVRIAELLENLLMIAENNTGE